MAQMARRAMDVRFFRQRPAQITERRDEEQSQDARRNESPKTETKEMRNELDRPGGQVVIIEDDQKLICREGTVHGSAGQMRLTWTVVTANAQSYGGQQVAISDSDRSEILYFNLSFPETSITG